LKATAGSVIFISGVGGRTPGAQFAIGGSVNAALLSLTKALSDLGIRDGAGKRHQPGEHSHGALRRG
jgi:3-oxoacyl-[acyl-carrier protein] reductase